MSIPYLKLSFILLDYTCSYFVMKQAIHFGYKSKIDLDFCPPLPLYMRHKKDMKSPNWQKHKSGTLHLYFQSSHIKFCVKLITVSVQ